MPASIWYHYYIKFLFENSVTGVTLSRCSKVPKIYMKKPHSVSIEVRSQNARKEEESSPRCIKTRCTHNTSSLARRFSKIDKSRPNDCIKCCMTVLFFLCCLGPSFAMSITKECTKDRIFEQSWRTTI